MAEKLTTLDQLKRLAIRGKADSAAQISELAALVVAGLDDVQHVGVTVTLLAANWNDRAQKVKHKSFLADSRYWYFVYGGIGVSAADITLDGQVTFQCEDVPDADLTVNIVRLGVEMVGDQTNVGKVFNLTGGENLKAYIDKRFNAFCNALLYDSGSKAILDSENRVVAS